METRMYREGPESKANALKTICWSNGQIPNIAMGRLAIPHRWHHS